MSVWSTAVAAPLPLFGTEGALVSVSISIESPHLEALLDVLARLDFPINPQIYHAAGPDTVVEFPAYENRRRLRRCSNRFAPCRERGWSRGLARKRVVPCY